MGRLKDVIKSKPEIIFEHKHYRNGKRKKDNTDQNVINLMRLDNTKYKRRKNKPLWFKLSVAHLLFINTTENT